MPISSSTWLWRLRAGALALALAASLGLAPPPPESLSAAEEATLASRQVMQRYVPERSFLLAAIDVNADPDLTFREVMDIGARVGEVKGFQRVVIYIDEPTRRAAEIHIGFATFEGVVNIDFRVDAAARFTQFGLDPGRKSDMNPTSGSYEVGPRGAGCRILYRSSMSGVAFAPDWLQKYMATTASRELLIGIRNRAERNRT